MAYVSMTKPTLGDATKKSFADQLIDNDEALNNSLGSVTSGIVNGSFETGTGADAPTGWVFGTIWGTKGFDTTTPIHGAQAYTFTSSGAGGGELQSEDFIGCGGAEKVNLEFFHKSSAAGIHNLVELLWYDEAQSYLSLTAIYDDTATNPTSWTLFHRGATSPSTARFFKIKITGASNDDATAGVASFDGFRIISGVKTVVGSGVSAGDPGLFKFVHIGGTLASADCGALATNTIIAAKSGQAGGTVAVDARNDDGSKFAINLTLPVGSWTVFAVASGNDIGGVVYINIAAVAVREG